MACTLSLNWPGVWQGRLDDFGRHKGAAVPAALALRKSPPDGRHTQGRVGGPWRADLVPDGRQPPYCSGQWALSEFAPAACRQPKPQWVRRVLGRRASRRCHGRSRQRCPRPPRRRIWHRRARIKTSGRGMPCSCTRCSTAISPRAGCRTARRSCAPWRSPVWRFVVVQPSRGRPVASSHVYRSCYGNPRPGPKLARLQIELES